MNKVVVICGFSSSGKDSLTKYISDNYDFEMIMSTTSRPIRPTESEGNPYHFITREIFEAMIDNDEFIECRKYETLVNNIPDTWFYGVEKGSVDLSKHSYIVVLDLLGLVEFKKCFPDNIVSFFIDVDEPIRRDRCIKREGFNKTEWDRRYADDLQQFSKKSIENEVDYIVENYDFIRCALKIIRRIV